MTYETVTYEKSVKVVTIALNCPDRLNALSDRMEEELRAALGEADRNDGTSVVVLKGNGRAFCAEYDISPSSELSAAKLTIAQDRERYRKPIIGQVRGYCLAVGHPGRSCGTTYWFRPVRVSTTSASIVAINFPHNDATTA